jgi:hypothetical protein
MSRVDCHVHTKASWDGLLDYRRCIAEAVAAGLDAVIVCDHNTLSGAEALRDMNPPFRVISGIELSTTDGELLAFFIRENIPARLPAEEAIARVHAQGALVVLPHPFVRTAANRIRPRNLERLVDLADAVEGFNGRNGRASTDEIGREWATRHGKPLTAGSDAHLPGGIGTAYLEIDDFSDAASFLANLPAARPVVTRRSSDLANVLGFARVLARLAFNRLHGTHSDPNERKG